MAVKRKLAEDDTISKKKTRVETKCCSGCQETLSVSQFSLSKRDGYSSKCKACYSVYHKSYSNTRKGAINRIIRGTKYSTKGRNASGKRNLATPTLTAQQFDAILTQQGDRCAYSGLPLGFGTYRDWTVSGERLDNDVTYELSNVVAIVSEMNTASQWSRELAGYAATHQDSVDPETVEANCAVILTKPDNKTGMKCKKVHRMTDDEGIEWAFCNSCEEMKVVSDDFHKVVGQGCKTCHAIKCKKRSINWRGRFQQLLSSARTRNAKLQKTREVEDFDLTLEFLVDMYRAQQGACAYSRIPLAREGHWKASLERKNVRKGYTMDNVCLIAVAFNSADHTVYSKDQVVEGCSGWSAEKYLYFRANFQ